MQLFKRLFCPRMAVEMLPLGFIYSKVSQPRQPGSLLSTTYQRRRDDAFGDNGLFWDDCRREGGGVKGGVGRVHNGRSTAQLSLSEAQSQNLLDESWRWKK